MGINVDPLTSFSLHRGWSVDVKEAEPYIESWGVVVERNYITQISHLYILPSDRQVSLTETIPRVTGYKTDKQLNLPEQIFAT